MLVQGDAAFGTDGQDMAAVFAQDGFNFCFEVMQQFLGNKGLHSSGKAAAVYSERAPALQQLITHG